MRLSGRTFTRQARLISIILAVVGVTVIGSIARATHADSGGGTMTLSPASGSATVNGNLVLTLNENSNAISVIGAEAYINYPASLLQFVSASTNSIFTVAPGDTASGGVLHIVRGQYPPGVSGSEPVTTITFKVLAAGTAPLTFTNQSNLAPNSAGDTITLATTGGSYTLSTAPVTPPPTTPPTTPPPATPAPPATGGSGSSKNSSDSISSSSTAKPVAVANGGTAQVSKTVSVGPTTVQTQGVKKIEYYLDGKLVDTETVAPYTYNVDTTKLKNGTHVLLTKTYYDNGTTKSSSQNLVITDGIKASKTAAVWTITPILIVLVIVGVFLYTHVRRRPVLMPAGMNQAQPIIGSDNPVVAKPPTNPTDDILHNMHASAPPPSTVIQPEGSKSPPDPHNSANG